MLPSPKFGRGGRGGRAATGRAGGGGRRAPAPATGRAGWNREAIRGQGNSRHRWRLRVYGRGAVAAAAGARGRRGDAGDFALAGREVRDGGAPESTQACDAEVRAA